MSESSVPIVLIAPPENKHATALVRDYAGGSPYWFELLQFVDARIILSVPRAMVASFITTARSIGLPLEDGNRNLIEALRDYLTPHHSFIGLFRPAWETHLLSDIHANPSFWLLQRVSAFAREVEEAVLTELGHYLAWRSLIELAQAEDAQRAASSGDSPESD